MKFSDLAKKNKAVSDKEINTEKIANKVANQILKEVQPEVKEKLVIKQKPSKPKEPRQPRQITSPKLEQEIKDIKTEISEIKTLLVKNQKLEKADELRRKYTLMSYKSVYAHAGNIGLRHLGKVNKGRLIESIIEVELN